MAKEVKEVKKKDEDWMTKKWRPLMAMMYMTCCLADFFLFPVMFTVVQFWETQAANDAFRQWVPITLQGGGLFHVAMGAVLGVSAYGRTQEKVAGASNVSTGLPTSGVPTPTLSSAVPTYQSGGFGSPTPTGFGAPTGYGAPNTGGYGGGFNGTSGSDFNQQPISVTVGFGGKPAPMPAPQPLL
jgi:hypothetical protein